MMKTAAARRRLAVTIAIPRGTASIAAPPEARMLNPALERSYGVAASEHACL